jgi:ecdysone 20-monooxygenase
MGFLDRDVDPLARRLATAVQGIFRASNDTFYGLPFWKVFPSRSYKLFEKSEEEIYE